MAVAMLSVSSMLTKGLDFFLRTSSIETLKTLEVFKASRTRRDETTPAKV
jgi:hypothetical protein